GKYIPRLDVVPRSSEQLRDRTGEWRQDARRLFVVEIDDTRDFDRLVKTPLGQGVEAHLVALSHGQLDRGGRRDRRRGIAAALRGAAAAGGERRRRQGRTGARRATWHARPGPDAATSRHPGPGRERRYRRSGWPRPVPA